MNSTATETIIIGAFVLLGGAQAFCGGMLFTGRWRIVHAPRRKDAKPDVNVHVTTGTPEVAAAKSVKAA